MNSLKDHINEVHKEKHFDLERQLETIQKARQKKAGRRKFHWQPLFATVGIAFITLLFVYFQVEQQPANLPASSELAPEHAEVAFMERLAQFQQIIADGTITDEERRQFLSTSDWLLQRAFESGNSLFYNRPKMTADEVLQVNMLLSYMNEFVEQHEHVRKLANIELEGESFREVLALLPEWNAHFATLIPNTYVPTNEEKPRTNNAFLNGPLNIKLLWTVGFLLLVYAFVFNLRYMRKILLGVIQISLIFFFGSAFFKEDTRLYGHDETAIMHSINQNNEMKNSETLLAAATFHNVRYVLTRFSDNSRIGISIFSRGDKTYELYGGHYLHSSANIVIIPNSLEYLEQGNIVGIADNSKITKVVLTDNYTNEQYEIEIDPVKANIYRLIIPEQLKGYYIDVYDVEGERVPW